MNTDTQFPKINEQHKSNSTLKNTPFLKWQSAHECIIKKYSIKCIMLGVWAAQSVTQVTLDLSSDFDLRVAEFKSWPVRHTEQRAYLKKKKVSGRQVEKTQMIFVTD